MTAPQKATRITSGDVRKAMAGRWCAPEWAIMWEVGEATGAIRGRYADAVMMSLWPSRGLELHGVEIKVSRSDWKREAADPSKAEAIAKFCDRWWVHTAPGVVNDLSDLPPAWGLREWDGRSWSTRREAEKTAAEPASRAFLAAMLRRADDTMRKMIEEVRSEGREAARADLEKERASIAERIEEGVKRRLSHLEAAAKNVAAFEAAFGRGSAKDYAIRYGHLGAAARTLSECNEKGFGGLVTRLRRAADEIEAIASMTTPTD